MRQINTELRIRGVRIWYRVTTHTKSQSALKNFEFPLFKSLSDLKVRTRDAFGNLFEERVLDLDELCGLNHVQDLLDLPEEHHLQPGTRCSPFDKSIYRQIS
jgi:hypothetical protein